MLGLGSLRIKLRQPLYRCVIVSRPPCGGGNVTAVTVTLLCCHVVSRVRPRAPWRRLLRATSRDRASRCRMLSVIPLLPLPLCVCPRGVR